MAKISIQLWKSKKSQDGTMPLYLVIHHRGRRSTLALPVRTKEKDWNKKEKELRKSHPFHARLNPYLKGVAFKAEEAVVDAIVTGVDIDPAAIKRAVAGEKEASSDFLADFERRIQEFIDRGQHGSVDAYSPVLAKLRAYVKETLKKSVLPHEDLTVSFLRGFETHLIQKHGNGVNTVSKNLGYIRSVLYIAIREGRFSQDKNPFFNISLKSRRAEKSKLTIEEIWKLEDAKLPPGIQTDARNYFVFAFYAAGMRVSDVIFLKGGDIEVIAGQYRLSYTMIKTGQVAYPMVLNAAAQRILHQYGWPNTKTDEFIFPAMPAGVVPDSQEGFNTRKKITALLNKTLKTVGKKAGIDTPITTHMARHSWTYHLDRNNIPVQRISDTLSHGDLKTTQAYVKKVRTVEVDDQLTKILERV